LIVLIEIQNYTISFYLLMKDRARRSNRKTAIQKRRDIRKSRSKRATFKGNVKSVSLDKFDVNGNLGVDYKLSENTSASAGIIRQGGKNGFGFEINSHPNENSNFGFGISSIPGSGKSIGFSFSKSF
jgi:hypothetical protein